MSRFYKLLFLSFFMLFMLNSQAQAAVYTCGTNGVNNSCSPAGLSSLVNNATHGDTINIAPGTHSWNTSVTLDKRLTISGGGACPDCGDEDPSGSWSWPTTLTTNRNMAFLVNGSNGSNPDFVRISGLFIDGDPPNHSYSNGANTASIVMHTNNEMRYRIDNIRFRPSGNSEQSQYAPTPMSGLVSPTMYTYQPVERVVTEGLSTTLVMAVMPVIQTGPGLLCGDPRTFISLKIPRLTSPTMVVVSRQVLRTSKEGEGWLSGITMSRTLTWATTGLSQAGPQGVVSHRKSMRTI